MLFDFYIYFFESRIIIIEECFLLLTTIGLSETGSRNVGHHADYELPLLIFIARFFHVMLDLLSDKPSLSYLLLRLSNINLLLYPEASRLPADSGQLILDSLAICSSHFLNHSELLQ